MKDFITTILCVGPIVCSLMVTARVLNFLENAYLKIFVTPFVLALSFIAVIFIFRILLPPLKKGVYPIGLNMGFFGWFTHSMLTRSARVFGVHYLIHSISVFRWLYWKALGAKAAFNISTSYKITLHDMALIEIENGVTLAEDVEISGHVVRGDRVLVAPVKIGLNTFIGRGTYIGPRTRIGENCWIGMNNNVTGEVIASGTKIASHEWAQGNPKTRKTNSVSTSQDNLE